MTAGDTSLAPVLVATAVTKSIGRSRPPTWIGRIVDRLNARANGGIDEDDEFMDDVFDDDEPRPMISGVVEGLSLAVRPGEVMGLLSNSPLAVAKVLQVLAGVSPVTSGRIDVRGRAVLVSAGLTKVLPKDGTLREAIFAIGALLRIPPRVTRASLDEIVEFAGLSDRARVPRGPAEATQLVAGIGLYSDADVYLVDLSQAFHSKRADPFFRARTLELLDARRRMGAAIVFGGYDQAWALRGLAERTVLFEGGDIRVAESLSEADEIATSMWPATTFPATEWSDPQVTWEVEPVEPSDGDLASLWATSTSHVSFPGLRVSVLSAGDGFDQQLRLATELSLPSSSRVTTLRFALQLALPDRSRVAVLQPEATSAPGGARVIASMRGRLSDFTRIAPAVEVCASGRRATVWGEALELERRTTRRRTDGVTNPDEG